VATPTRFAPPRPHFPHFDPIVRHLASLNYWNRRLFLAKRIAPKKYPHFQYKYKALGVDQADRRTKHLRDILVESRLWLSSPRDFNDPFDMTARVIFEGTTQRLRKRFKKLIAEKSGKQRKERRALLDQFMRRPRHEWLQAIERVHAENHAQTGVVSFAGDPRSVLMWSHYGEHHSGVCLQFTIAKDPTTFVEAVPVHYVRDYPAFNWAEDTASQVGASLMHKFEEWRYEHEWRIVWPSGAHTYLPFDAAALTGLIFGCRAPDSAIALVKDMLYERKARGLPTVRTYRAAEHGRKYALVIRRT